MFFWVIALASLKYDYFENSILCNVFPPTRKTLDFKHASLCAKRLCKAVIWYVQSGYMVNWSEMRCRQGPATRRKRFQFVTLKIYCFYTLKNIRECQRGNASKAIDRCSTATVSRDLSRLWTSRAIMLCGKELVNACMGTEIHLFCINIPGILQLHTLVWCYYFLWAQQSLRT